jgi:hypothetical protein
VAATAGHTIDRGRALIRVVLVFVAISGALVSVWILAAPRHFYDNFPIGPSEWVLVLPPYNEHLLRDYGAATLGLTLLTVAAAVLMERRLVQVALLSLFAAGTPHLAYHLTTTEHYSTGDGVASLTALALQSLLPLALLALTVRPRRARPATGAQPAPKGA